ncbi:hypothetical protein GC105_09140 [Alkalibaculum sp. M08DMB]|uniref:DUF4355 domain-containing protein n=1 Tax=Alkalibaculum sporogenes TaxID=2655001 RepID=A0A6A7K955_9FIRM|nr:hypothetical protein [Alkalibaculum sporogenes]MPW25954.1 hypothetical protein [Alkalibaculum sporogenes]
MPFYPCRLKRTMEVSHLGYKQEENIMKNLDLIPMNIQLFAEDKTDPDPPAGGSGESSKQEDTKTFTQDDVNNVVARESKAAVEKLLKEAGIAPEGDYKASMQAFKEWQDSQKTELEKVTGNLTTLEQAKAEAEAKATLLEQKFKAVSKGIPADKAHKYIKLAEAYMDDKTDFEKALGLALKDFPVVENGTPGTGGNPPPTPGTEKTPLPSGMVIF